MSVLWFLLQYFILDRLVLFHKTGFRHVRCFWDGFKEEIFGGGCWNCPNPYLNSATVLFNNVSAPP